ncbi:ABC transporter permease [Ruminiclostridium cellobioparum]|jgi:oligopeptide transport system permease protein|uniref:ABC transporter permease n=1 Tax=Ruminiclostridium cellobioparum TaxID=29355 RepID=UPI00048290D3|nr:ABC transporter permease [Ruminiclostridium cellobioparum]
MGRYILKRLGYLLVTMWIIITATFFLMNTLPGDPVQTGTKLLPEAVAQNLRVKWGFDKPVTHRYVIYLNNLLHGDFGESMKTPGLTANAIIRDKFPASARLGLQAITFGLLVGLILGIIAAFKRNTWIDYTVIFIAIAGISIPSFVLAALLQKVIGGSLLPIIGWPSTNVWLSGFEYTILPTLAASFGSIATYSRFMRTSVLEVLNNDYILTAKAKGLSRREIVQKHVLRNSLIPIITIFAPQMAGIVTGSFVIERIFCIPGLGMYYVESINGRDFPMIMATTIFFSFFFIISIVLMDILYGIIDPRVRVSGEKR